MAVQPVLVTNSSREPVHAVVPDAAGKHWAIACSQYVENPGKVASTIFGSSRPALIEMVGADLACADGFLIVDSSPRPNPPTDPKVIKPAGGGEAFKGAMFKIPIQNGMVPPTPIVLPIQKAGDDYEFSISIEAGPTTPFVTQYGFSVVGRFLD